MSSSSSKKKLGDILVDVGVITPEQLKEALEIQKQKGGKLGQILAQMGVINEEVILGFLGKQCGVSYVSIEEFGKIPEHVINAIPESLVRHQLLVPIAKDNNTLKIAMADPFNVFAVDDVKMLTGFDVEVVIASENEIREVINKYYPNLPETDTNPPLETHHIEGIDISKKLTNPDDEYVISLILNAVNENASDIHIEPQDDSLRIRHRIDGIVYEKALLPKEVQNKILYRIKLMANLSAVEQNVFQENRIKIKNKKQEIELRVFISPTVFGEKIIIHRINPFTIQEDLDKLGFEKESLDIVKQNIKKPNGLFLFTGPNGAGKTTTVYSVLANLNSTDCNIVTIEDPVEFALPGITQIQVNSNKDVTINSILKALWLHNADTVMTSETHDKNTFKNIFNTALEGYKIISILTSNDSIETLSYLIKMGVEPFILTSTLKLIVNQRLVRLLCTDCKENYEVTKEDLKKLSIKNIENKGKIKLWRSKGCKNCANTGYKGRTEIFEVLELDDELNRLILENANEDTLRDYINKKGIITLKEAAWRKVISGVTTIEEMLKL